MTNRERLTLVKMKEYAMQKQLQLYMSLLITTIVLGACTFILSPPKAEQMEGTIPSVQDEEPTLTGVTWQWVSLADPMGNIDVPMPEQYTVTFLEDNTVNIKADCNNASGSYSVDGGTITIVIGPMTLAACPPDSLSDQFVRDLGFAATYFFADDQLLIDMMADGGTMTFAALAEEPAGGDSNDTSNENSAMTNVIEATFMCPDGTAIDAVFDNGADTVTITLPDQTITLPRAISGSGARYGDKTTTFWNQGNEALVEIDGETIYQNCVAEEAAATEGDGKTGEAAETKDDGETGEAVASTSALLDVTWQLVEIQYMDDSVVTPSDPTQYTLTLLADGSVAAQVDCNRGRGSYDLADSSLSFGELATTRMMCPPESLANQYQQGLTDATSYVLEEGDLYIAFGPDAGILHFTPIANDE